MYLFIRFVWTSVIDEPAHIIKPCLEQTATSVGYLFTVKEGVSFYISMHVKRTICAAEARSREVFSTKLFIFFPEELHLDFKCE